MKPGEAQTLLAELAELVGNLGFSIAGSEIVRLREPNATFLVGRGKVDEITEHCRELGVQAVVFDEALTPAQQRNWERVLAADLERHASLDVTDRQEIILDIFAERARTREAALQVELAQLEYYLPRLKRAWSHLSRQRGGGTGARGQGETQLEVDRRYIKDRIALVRAELTAVLRHRDVQRRKRQRNAVPSAAIVGYTNAGKSTLLNRLTSAHVLAEDKLFATLDPTTRQLVLPARRKLLVTDTVGFIRRLPTRLVEAFKATLEEVVLADFLIHVVDVSNPEAEAHIRTTREVLREIGAVDKPEILVFNKVDAASDTVALETLRLLNPGAHFVSCLNGDGIPRLLDALELETEHTAASATWLIPHDRYDLVARLHDLGCVRHAETRDDGVLVEGPTPPSLAGALAPFATHVLPATQPTEEIRAGS